MSREVSINLASPIIYGVWIYAMVVTYNTPSFWVLAYLFIKDFKLTLTWNWR